MAKDNVPTFTTHPKIYENPNLSAPLAAILSYSTDKKVETTVDISDGEREWKINFDNSHKPQDGLPILGMRPNRKHKFKISIQDMNGNISHAPEELEFKTPTLPHGPREWPPIQVHVSKPEQMEPGITLMSVRRRLPMREKLMSKAQRKFGTDWSMIIALDMEGEIVWYYSLDTRVAGFDFMQNGHLFYLTTDFREVEIDMLGNKVAEWYAGQRPQGPVEDAIPVNTQTIHHQPHELPWGNFLVMTAYSKEIKNYYTSENDPDAPRNDMKVMGDEIVEFNREGSIVWNWNSFEHLDPYRIGYMALGTYWQARGFPYHADWTHGNGLNFDEQNDAVLISLRGQDAIIKVERSTGEIKWILGDHFGWADKLKDKLLKPEGKVHWPYHMHNPKATPAGTVLLWDNGIFQALPFDGRPIAPPHQSYSRAVEYAVDEEKMTVREVWASSEKGSDNDSCNCFAMGDVHWMSRTGNVLVFYGGCLANRDDMTYNPKDLKFIGGFPGWTRVREFTHTDSPEIVFEVVIADPDEVFEWQSFGGMRINSFYPSS